MSLGSYVVTSRGEKICISLYPQFAIYSVEHSDFVKANNVFEIPAYYKGTRFWM